MLARRVVRRDALESSQSTDYSAAAFCRKPRG